MNAHRTFECLNVVSEDSHPSRFFVFALWNVGGGRWESADGHLSLKKMVDFSPTFVYYLL